jgi:two-component system response regulator YesN
MILVEDESFERDSLKNYINWSLIGVKIIGEAANGAQGFSLVMDLRPDIVLTDVKMPVMDGIELSRKIRGFSPETKILFLSSYDDFEYAKQAIDLAIQAYVMKPVNEGELLRVVKKAADEVMEKALEQWMYDKIKNDRAISQDLARQALVNRALTGLPIAAEHGRNLGLEWLCSPSECLCLFLSFYDAQKIASIDERLETLNRDCGRVCTQSISACLNSGTMITLCAVTPDTSEADIYRVRQMLGRFFENMGVANARVEWARSTETLRTPADLYETLRRRGVGSGPPAHSEAVSGKKFQAAKNKEQIARETKQLIDAEYHLPLTLESIARKLHFTPNYIGIVFKSVEKISVNRYLMNVRMAKAAELLLDEALSLDDIVEKCGFASITYFYTAFKKETGVTPGEFRQLSAGRRAR